MVSKERWQKLAGLAPEAESNEEPKTLQEGFENLGMAPVGVLGNPFGNRPKEPEYNFEGILEDMVPDLDSEKTNAEDDDEGAMARSQLEQMKHQAEQLLEKLSDDAKLESWVQSKLTLAAEMLDVVTHHLQDEDEDEQHDAHVEAHEDKEEEGKEDLDVDLEIVDDNDKDDKEDD